MIYKCWYFSSVEIHMSLPTLEQMSQNMFCVWWSYLSNANSLIEDVLKCHSLLLLGCSLIDMMEGWSSVVFSLTLILASAFFSQRWYLTYDDCLKKSDIFLFWHVFLRPYANLCFSCLYFATLHEDIACKNIKC